MLTTSVLVALLASASPAFPVTVATLVETTSEIATAEEPQRFDLAPGVQEVVVARVAPDGTIVTACVASDEDAARLLRKPAAPQQPQHQEQ